MKKRRVYPKITWCDSKQAYRCTLPVSGKRRDVYGKTPDEVMDKVDAIEAEAERGVDPAMTFMAYARRWGALKSPGLKPKSREVYENALKVHIFPHFGALKLADIKPIHIDELLCDLQKQGRSASLCRKVLFTCAQIFESAVENGLIVKNPCRGKKAGGERAKAKTPLTKAQQAQLCAAVEGTRANVFVLLCLYAGLRGEEARGLLWGDVHLDGAAPYIDIRHSATFDLSGRPIHSGDLKTAAAYRSIPVPPQLADALRTERKTARDLFVVPAKGTGGAMSLSAFRRVWDLVTRRVDFPVTPHLLRHTYISELCAAGLDIKKIQYLAGHATVQMTLNVYTHVTQNTPDQLAPVINAAFVAGKPAGNEKAESV